MLRTNPKYYFLRIKPWTLGNQDLVAQEFKMFANTVSAGLGKTKQSFNKNAEQPKKALAQKLKSNIKQKKADFNKLYTELKNTTKQPIDTSASRYSKMDEVKLVTIGLASANRIRQWAEKTLPNGKVIGEVTNANTLHHKTFKPQKGGLFCERIFGPLKDFECACGTKKTKEFLNLKQNSKTTALNNFNNLSQDKNLENSNISSINSSYTNLGSGQPSSKNYKRFYCSKCDVEYTWSVIRRYQLGYIKLNAPVTHVWYVKGNPSYISLLLDMKKKDLEYVIYCTETLTIENSLKASATADEFSIGAESAKEMYELWQNVATKNASNNGLTEIVTAERSPITNDLISTLGTTKPTAQQKNSSKKHKNIYYLNSITSFKQSLKPMHNKHVASVNIFNAQRVKNSSLAYGLFENINILKNDFLNSPCKSQNTTVEYRLQDQSTLKNFYKTLFQAAVLKDSSGVNSLSNQYNYNNLAAKLNKSFCATKSLENLGVMIYRNSKPKFSSSDLSVAEAKVRDFSNGLKPFQSFNTLYSLVALKQKRYLDSVMAESIRMFKSFSAPCYGFRINQNLAKYSAFKMLVKNSYLCSKSLETNIAFNKVTSPRYADRVEANFFKNAFKNLYTLSYMTATTEITLRFNHFFANQIGNHFERSSSVAQKRSEGSLPATEGFKKNQENYFIKYLVGCLKKRNKFLSQFNANSLEAFAEGSSDLPLSSARSLEPTRTKLVTKLNNIQLLILKGISGNNSKLGKVFKFNPCIKLFKLLALRQYLSSSPGENAACFADLLKLESNPAGELHKNFENSTPPGSISFILNRNLANNQNTIKTEKGTYAKHASKYFMSKKSLISLVKIIYLQKTLVTTNARSAPKGKKKSTKLVSFKQNTCESIALRLGLLCAYNVEAFNRVKSHLLNLTSIKKLSKPYTLSLLKVFFLNRITCLIKKSRIVNFTSAPRKEDLEVKAFNKIKSNCFKNSDLVLFQKSGLKSENKNQSLKQAGFSTSNSDRNKLYLQTRLSLLVSKPRSYRAFNSVKSQSLKTYKYLFSCGSGKKAGLDYLTRNKLNLKLKKGCFLLSSSYAVLNTLSAELGGGSFNSVKSKLNNLNLTTTKKKQQTFHKSKSLYIVNNLYCLSHREMWEQEKDWYFFALYFFNAPDLDDISVPVYEYRNYDFSLLNSLFSPEQKLTSVNQSEPAQDLQKSRLTRLLEKQDKPNLHITYSGAGIIQTLLAEFDYFELKKMDKQNRILLYDLNRYIKKLKRSLAVGILGKNITGSFNFLTSNNLNIDTLDNSLRNSELSLSNSSVFAQSLQKNQEHLSFAKNYSLLKKEFKEVCKQRDLLIRRTKLIRKIFRNYLGFSKSTAMDVYNSNSTSQQTDSQGPGFKTNVNNLTSMVLTVLPVLPPDLRPIIKMGSQIAASDLNRLYQRVIYRNDRLKKFLNDTATNGSYEMKYAQRLLQEAVDNLIQNGKSGVVPEKDARGRALKSLSELLKGKQGRFRQYLLGKRVDYSGRSVIVVGPKLKLHECGIPKEMALELYLPFLIKRILTQNLARTVVGAKSLIKNNKPLAWSLLREIMKTCPVLLNRAPTLHRLGFQAFQPKLVDGRAILLHPLACPAFNADFDGDQMAVHVPITPEARTEAWKLMLSRNSLLSPATGEPLVLPSQDMVLGCYYLTTNSNIRTQKYEKGYGMYFDSFNNVLRAYYDGIVATHSIVWVKWTGTYANYNGGQHQGEQPIEIRINNYGSAHVIYSKTHLTLAPHRNSKYSLNQNKLNKLGISNNNPEANKEIHLKNNSLEMHWPEFNQQQKYSQLRDSNYSNNTILVNQIIRTTPGKIIFNALIQKSWNG
jgi:DNA-directed RNA polymerase subunit beta'